MAQRDRDTPRDPDLSALYRESAQAQPPAALDERVLAAARQALVTPARRGRWWRRWGLAASVAVTVVLASALTLVVEREQARRGQPPGEAPAPERREAAPQIQAEPVHPADRSDSPPPKAPPPRAPAPQSASSAGPGAAPAPAVPALESPVREAPATANDAAEQRRAAPLAAPAQDRGAPAGSPAPASRGAVPSREAAPAMKGAVPQAEEARAPQPWLEEIRALRRAGRAREADEALAAFRAAYPDFPLPEDLRSP